MTLHLFYGHAVSGSQRFPRPDLEADMLRVLEHSSGLKMFHLRRIGKSTFTVLAEERMRDRGYTVVSVDAQGLRSPDQLLFAMFAALPRHEGGLLGRMTAWVASDAAIPQLLRDTLSGALKGIVPRDKDVSSGINHYWPTISAQIVRALQDERTKMLMTIDEFTYLLKNMMEDPRSNEPGAQGRQQADMLLASMREWRKAGLKMILTGSIGLLGLARKHRFSIEHVNDLSSFQIPPLRDEEARAFIAAAVAGHPGSTWTDAHTQALLHESQILYPAFLVKGLLAIGMANPPPVEAFSEIFASRVRPELHDNFIAQLNTRFRLYRDLDNAAQRALIVPILKQIMATSPAPCPQSSLKSPGVFDQIDVQDGLSLLHEDGFILYNEARDGGRDWRSSSRLVDLWWKRTGL